MIKGLLLATTIAVFITSLIFTITGFLNLLQKNIITGAVIGSQQLAVYSVIPLVLSFIIGVGIIATLIRKN